LFGLANLRRLRFRPAVACTIFSNDFNASGAGRRTSSAFVTADDEFRIRPD
jgi:hypothetical protein